MKRARLTLTALLRLGAITTALGMAAACAPVPRPPVLAQLEQVRSGSAATEAQRLAPQAYAHAEQLRKQADEAFTAGDAAGAELLGERAIAAYAHAAALSRIARAQAGADDAEAKLAASKTELSALDAEQIRVAAEADALDLRLRVARDAQPIQPSGRADPAREQARLAAARALSLQARLLCGAARLLLAAPPVAGASAPDPKLGAQVDEATNALGKVETALAPLDPKAPPAPASATPIDEATRVRAGCLAALTAVRRASTPVSRAPGAGDALLAELSAMGALAPSRDDRGVIVTLRGLFRDKGDKGSPALTPAADARLAELGRVAAAHPAFPALVVLHQEKALDPRDEPAQRARVEAVARSFGARAAGVRVEPILAGNVAPVVDPTGADRARNARVEIVFVTPESF